MWGLKDNDFILSSCITNKQNAGLIVNNFELNPGYTKEMISLNTGSQRVMDTPNAGGSSVWSEAISFEVLSFMCSAALHKTEMEIEYMPGSKITDYSVKVLGRDLGVSVTRAMKFSKKDDTTFTEEDAHKLLSKKLRGVNESTKGVVSSPSSFSTFISSCFPLPSFLFLPSSPLPLPLFFDCQRSRKHGTSKSSTCGPSVNTWRGCCGIHMRNWMSHLKATRW